MGAIATRYDNPHEVQEGSKRHIYEKQSVRYTSSCQQLKPVFEGSLETVIPCRPAM